MTAKIEAKRIFEQYFDTLAGFRIKDCNGVPIENELIKECALIDVHNTLKVVRQLNNYAFYQEVKTELEKY